MSKKEINIYDTIIIGAGPAGITASVYAARKQMNFLVITKDVGGQTIWTEEIANYTGYQFITGPELALKFQDHIDQYNIPVRKDEEVIEVRKDHDGNIKIVTVNDTLIARTVIIASGKRPKELHVPGEKEFRNKGLTYCATCDGPLFKGKDVLVVGGGNSALEAALQLVRITNLVYMVNISPEVTGDLIIYEKVAESDKFKLLNNSRVKEIKGDGFINRVDIVNDGKDETLDVQGVFVEIGLDPNAVFARDMKKNEFGEIIVNGYCQTNIPGIYAAGDVTDVPEKQIIIAAGEGAKAVLGAFKYVAKGVHAEWG